MRRGRAVLRATRDGAVWIGHVRTEPPPGDEVPLKLAAARAFAGAEYVAAGNYVWNSGMFCFTPAAILAAAAMVRRLPAPHAPDTHGTEAHGTETLRAGLSAFRAIPSEFLAMMRLHKDASSTPTAFAQ